jgi:histidine triad (HIT) family protein
VELKQYDTDNIFAKIIRGEMPNVTVYEDDDVLSFMDVFPQSEGHTLVIPKQAEATNFLDIDSYALATLIQRTQKVAKAVNDALQPDGIRIVQFNGAAAGQTVFHIHFHIIPIWEGRPVKMHGSSPADTGELQALADKIKTAL